MCVCDYECADLQSGSKSREGNNSKKQEETEEEAEEERRKKRPMQGERLAESLFKASRFYKQLRNVDLNQLLLFYTEKWWATSRKICLSHHI